MKRPITAQDPVVTAPVVTASGPSVQKSRRRLRWALTVGLLAAVAAGCVPPPVVPSDDGLAGAPNVTPHTLPSGALQYNAIRYGTRSGYEFLDLYRPAGGGPFPLVVWYHGGAWSTGGRWELPSGLRDSLLAAGYAVASADYRLVQLQNLQILNPWPDGLYDAKLAVKYLRSFAGQLGLDADRVVTSGHSAGGHLAVMVAVSRGSAGVSLPGGDPTVKGSFVFGAPMDIQRALSDFPSSAVANVPVRMMMGCALDGNFCDTTRMQPSTYLDAGDPPVKLVHGGIDLLVPPADAAVMFSKAGEVGFGGLTTETVAGLDHDTVKWSAPTSTYLPWLAGVL